MPRCRRALGGMWYPANDSRRKPGEHRARSKTACFQLIRRRQWLSDGYMNTAGGILPRGTDIDGKDGGQYGVAAHYLLKPIATEIGVYWMRYNARLPILNATTPNSAITDTALAATLEADGVPAAYAALSQRLSGITEAWEYPNGIHLMGVSASHKGRSWKFAGEVSYSDNLPVQINTADMFAALTRNGGPIGGRTLGRPKGFLLRGYDRFDKWQGQLSAVRTLGPMLGASSGLLAGEAAWQHVNLPGLDKVRYGRGFAWGYSGGLRWQLLGGAEPRWLRE